jgi:hypothetical protein
LALLLIGVKETAAQMAMPDHVCIGTTKKYSVNNASVPSTYTWKIDGVTQPTTTNEITITWNTAGQFLITVQERSADGCEGDIQSGIVYVYPNVATNEQNLNTSRNHNGNIEDCQWLRFSGNPDSNRYKSDNAPI